MTQVRPVLLMTRPRADSEAFVATLRACGETAFKPVISPLIGVEICGALPDPGSYRGVIFTSANGVAAYRALGGEDRHPCYVVGAATAAAAREAGFDPQSAEGDAAALLKMIRAAPNEGALLHLRGTHARGDLAATLTREGRATREAVIYDQPFLAPTSEARMALDGTVPVVAPLFSPRTAARFAAVAHARAPLLIACMSKAVQQEIVDLRAIENIVTLRSSGDAMLKAALHLIALARMLESGESAQ